MRKSLLIATAVLGAVTLTSCQNMKNRKAADDNVEKSVYVKVQDATIEKVAQTVDFTANMQAYKQTFIVPTMGGRIEKINAEVGDRVREGQILVELDKTQYNTYALQLANAEVTLSRMRPVYEAGGISKQQIDELETNINVLKETVSNLETNLTLRSPFNGVVTGRFNEVGDLFTMSPNAAGGVGILQVMQMDRLKAYVHVSEVYFPYVYMGMPVEVRAELYPDKSFEGKVTRIAPAISSGTRTFEVEVTIQNQSLDLRPGMYARTTFNMGAIDAVTVEDMAVQRQPGTNDRYVFVLNDNVVEKRPVTIGRQNEDRVEITSGVKAGETVVIAGGSKLMSGMEVVVVSEDSDLLQNSDKQTGNIEQ